MKFNQITPEQAGISSKDILNFMKFLNDRGLRMHAFLMMKGNDIFYEAYYKPFHKDYLHRMYSQTKSYVSIAIGLLEQDGLISLDDPIYKYFPDKIHGELDDVFKTQTIRNMLMMCTCVRPPVWFYTECMDRVEEYFATKPFRKPGIAYEYDSAGSQVLCELVERITGKKLIDFLRDRIFNKMGTFKDAYILETPTGSSWGDSGLLCTLRDNASFARFVMDYGKYDGEQILNENYLKVATSRLVDNSMDGHDIVESQGYGYQIWRCSRNGFAFLGMANQLTFMFKDSDTIFTCFASDMQFPQAREHIAGGIYQLVDKLSMNPLKEDKASYEELMEYTNKLELIHSNRKASSPLSKLVENKTYVCEPNQMNLKEFSISINGDKGVFKYVNATGYKEIEFGIGYNVFTTFPEEGYSNMVGKLVTKGYYYKCANSGGYTSDNRFKIDVQAIDKYFGNLFITINFDENGYAFVLLTKHAENFFREYFGEAVAKIKE